MPLRSVLKLSSHLCLGIQSGLFSQGFLSKTLFAFPLFPKYATYSAHPILLSINDPNYI